MAEWGNFALAKTEESVTFGYGELNSVVYPEEC
jgi:hypothetical protein